MSSGLAALLASLSLTLPAAPPRAAGRPAAEAPQRAAGFQALSTPEGADSCQAMIPREEARRLVPAFQTPAWSLIDRGEFTFRYRFYARAGAPRVSAMVVEGERAPGLVETKTVWEDGGRVLVFLDGPVAEHDALPLCARSQAPGFSLDGLYRVLRPRLSR